jgi:RimJ/RimL family protein N-acetyltransferase
MAHPIWPLFDLRIRTPRLEVRYLDDELSAELALLALRGVHDPDFMPFSVPWTDARSPEQERNALQYQWRCRAETTPAHWNLNFATIVDGAVIGSTSLMADNFPILRQFETGSWLGREFQGKGYGKEMRIASLHLGFAGFLADFATTGAFADNGPSLGVTNSLGYAEAGRRRVVRRGEPTGMIGFQMSRDHWQRHVRRDDIELFGAEPARELLGITDPNESESDSPTTQ